MRFSRLYIVLVILVTYACEQPSKVKKEEVPSIPFIPTMIRFNSCFTSAENEVSFPVWFDDSIISSKGILRITREYQMPDSEDDLGYTRMVKIYEFDKKGVLKLLTVKEYYEGVLINESRFLYKGTKDNYGFAEVKRMKSEIHFPDHFKIHTKTYHDDYLRYNGVDNDNQLFYVPNSKFWKVLSIDSLLAPDENDRICYGTPANVHRFFKVRNKVEESEVIDYNYSNADQLVRSLKIDNYPFITKRTFRFDKEHKCDGFVDSLYSGDLFLHAIESTISYEQNVLPVTVSHKFITSEGTVSVREIETFKYDYHND